MNLIEELKKVIEPVLMEESLELVEIRYRGEGRVPLIRIFIDRSEGVSINDCERVSRKIEAILEERGDLVPLTYQLEVSSPGVDRQLKTEKDFRRVQGKSIEVYLFTPIANSKYWEGKITDCRNNTLILQVHPVRKKAKTQGQKGEKTYREVHTRGEDSKVSNGVQSGENLYIDLNNILKAHQIVTI